MTIEEAMAKFAERLGQTILVDGNPKETQEPKKPLTKKQKAQRAKNKRAKKSRKKNR